MIEDGKYVPEKSVPAIVAGCKVTDKGTTGVTIYSCEESFNGIIVKGDSHYTIDGVRIDLEGDGGNDFIGLGAGILVGDNSKVTINDSDVKITGVTRCAFHAGGNSVTTLNNCRLSNCSPATEKMYPSWQLGIRGTNRVTQCCDNANVYYNNCHITGNGWGAVSIDGGIHNNIYLKDSTIDLTGPRARGYGAFAIGDAFISFDHCTCNVQGYPILMCHHGDGGSSGEFTGGSVVNSTLYGAMIISGKGSKLDVNQGTNFNTASSVFVIKGCNPYVNIDNAILNPANGVILQLMDSDDVGMGPSKFAVPAGEVDVPVSDRNLAAADPDEDVFMTLSNMVVNGDFYNSTTNLKANRREKINMQQPGMPEMEASDEHPPMDNEARQGVKNLSLNFTNVKVNGVISAATAAYKDGVTVIDVGNCEELSAVKQTPAQPVNNGVIVSFDKDSVWTVAGTSYLTSLTLASGAVIRAPEGKTLAMTVDGVKTKIIPDTYTGKIVMRVY